MCINMASTMMTAVVYRNIVTIIVIIVACDYNYKSCYATLSYKYCIHEHS